MRVSVLMGVRDGGPHLREAIESVLGQTFTAFELVVVDDASTDGTAAMLEAYRLKDARVVVLRNETNMGLTRSLNRGLGVARGEYVARLDADDVSSPERLAVQVEFLDRHPGIGLAGSACVLTDAEGRAGGLCEPPEGDTEIRWKMTFNNVFVHSTVMFRRSLFGPGEMVYDETFPYAQDYELWTRILDRSRAANIPRPLCRFRLHDDSTSAVHREEQRRLAARISVPRIRSLDPELRLSEVEMERLRRWMERWPDQLEGDDFVLCRAVFRLLNTFLEKHPCGSEAVAGLRRRLVHSVVTATPLERIWRVVASGLAMDLLSADSGAVLSRVRGGVCRRILRE